MKKKTRIWEMITITKREGVIFICNLFLGNSFNMHNLNPLILVNINFKLSIFLGIPFISFINNLNRCIISFFLLGRSFVGKLLNFSNLVFFSAVNLAFPPFFKFLYSTIPGLLWVCVCLSNIFMRVKNSSEEKIHHNFTPATTA